MQWLQSFLKKVQFDIDRIASEDINLESFFMKNFCF